MATTKSGVDLLDDLIAELQVAVSANANCSLPQPQAPSKAAKAAKAPAAPVAAPPGEKAELTLNSLDFRVGVIVSVEKHATADKLYCEQIDVGEAEPRSIASGLVPHYSLEQMMGRRLIVVANLKPRNLVGFKSFGMVLCAAKVGEDGKEKVEFIDPPENAAIGDRVVIAGPSGGPPSAALSPAQVDKQKAWETVGADLKVDDEGRATWRGQPLFCQALGEAEPCRAPTLRGCVIR